MGDPDVQNMIEDLAKRDFIVFAGAGIPSESAPPITWKELLRAFKDEEPTLAVAEVDKISEREYPDYAQEIFNDLKRENKEYRYFEILSEKLKTKNADCSLQQVDIIHSAQHVVTTNFDDSFEKALTRRLEDKEGSSEIQDLPELQIQKLNGDYSISYLHGRTSERFIVFKKSDYEAFYSSHKTATNDNLEQFLRHLYEERTIVFIGVSFNDRYLLNALDKFYNQIKQNDEIGKQKGNYKSKVHKIQHYALMLQDIGLETKDRYPDIEIDRQAVTKERQSKIKLLEELKIRVIPYIEHKNWMEWFIKIREKRRLFQSNQNVSVIEDPTKVV